jgi:VanZ family protein
VTADASRRTAISRWLPVVAWMAVIFALSSISGLRVSDDAEVDRPFRVVAHLGSYALLAALSLHAMAGLRPPRTRQLIVAYAISLLFGISDEIHQAFVPDRTGRLDDLAIDAVGAAVGLLVGYLALRMWASVRRREAP